MVPDTRAHVFETDEIAVALRERAEMLADRIEGLTGWRPKSSADALPERVQEPRAAQLLDEWKAARRTWEARLTQTDRARLSRFQKGEFQDEAEARAAKIWWLGRY
ncbi:hypothetical protein [Roseovarius aquimarinus]|uniref:Uncharacterized protein n=1 Tax=Roseovarius aquimarinus TaxID=1229156 RepID=A0ABW7I7P1_9RHOB